MDDNKFYKNILKEVKEEPTFWQKLSVTIAEGHVFGGILIYVVFIANLIGTTIFARKACLGLMQDLLYKFHMDTFSFSELSFLEFNILVSYIFAFLFGGLLIFSFLKIGSLIAKNAGFLYSHNLTKAILIAFMALYLVVAVIFMISGNPLLSVKVHNWAMPLLAFFGGFCMYSIRNH